MSTKQNVFTGLLWVQGPNGPRMLSSTEDILKLVDDFNEELNTVLTKHIALAEQLNKACQEYVAAACASAESEGYAKGYQAAMEESSSWNID